MTETWELIKWVPAVSGLGGALFGGGVVYGLMKAKIKSLEEGQAEQRKSASKMEEKIDKIEQMCVAFERFCRSQQGACSGKVHQRLDELVKTVADLAKEIFFIAGTLKGQKG